MLSFTELSVYIKPKPVSWITRARIALLKLLTPRPFADFPEQKLLDHRWAVQSALLRAVRLQDIDNIDRLQQLHEAMEMEMRFRGLM